MNKYWTLKENGVNNVVSEPQKPIDVKTDAAIPTLPVKDANSTNLETNQNSLKPAQVNSVVETAIQNPSPIPTVVKDEKGESKIITLKDDPFAASIVGLTKAIEQLTSVVQASKEQGDPVNEIPTVGETVAGFKKRMKFTDDTFNQWLSEDAHIVGDKFFANLTDNSWQPYREFIKVLHKLREDMKKAGTEIKPEPKKEDALKDAKEKGEPASLAQPVAHYKRQSDTFSEFVKEEIDELSKALQSNISSEIYHEFIDLLSCFKFIPKMALLEALQYHIDKCKAKNYPADHQQAFLDMIKKNDSLKFPEK